MKTPIYYFLVLLTVNENWGRSIPDHETKWENQYATEIKLSILKQLQMYESPKQSNFTQIYPQSLKERLFDDEQEEVTQLIFLAKIDQQYPSPQITVIEEHSPIEPDSIITLAKMSVFITPTIGDSDFFSILIKENNNLVSSVSISKEYVGWIDMDITVAFQKWIKYPKNVLKSLSLFCSNCNNQHINISSEKQHTPYFLAHVIKRKLPRQRRKLWTCNEDASCCSRPFYVSFQDLKWNWVLSPKGFWTNKCMGKCKDGNLNNSGCCAPKTFGSITMFYHNGDYILYGKKIENIVTKDCGCL
ncbi:growth/differentiation factor 8 [Hydra vulgaris]|uniref:Growth/differentiation factor 8 n=1 Tax=Hydra vulgaris TaxID=6087 RepID=A0ABM4BQT4_HYDVU